MIRGFFIKSIEALKTCKMWYFMPNSYPRPWKKQQNVGSKLEKAESLTKAHSELSSSSNIYFECNKLTYLLSLIAIRVNMGWSHCAFTAEEKGKTFTTVVEICNKIMKCYSGFSQSVANHVNMSDILTTWTVTPSHHLETILCPFILLQLKSK